MYLHCLKVAISVVLAKFEQGQVRAGEIVPVFAEWWWWWIESGQWGG